ncbi:MAG TPA: nuclear transport factor 2 family protein [Ilumatobacteraceae bacterium]|nr:nuclear transport factor 2 family protein [Ilumatobacteraceae bacterium]
MYRRMVAKGIRLGYRRVVAGKPRLVVTLAADDVAFTFPGDNSFAGTFHGKQELEGWLRRFASLSPEFRIHDVLVAGPPWNTRVALTFSDAIGDDYRNRGMEYLRLRWGKLQQIDVYLNTETLHDWEQRHPELAAAGTT